ncbi:hypothetical protein G5S_0233 [Chlamydia pecorum E58]|uniref:Uncharacterized protein n=1 Tax=Chlamydia pecorum (strain ATCC VR-628 / DSM 29919 / E58) TaxID=331635 RepID=A0AA34RCK8_CHLPE|nr:hypothetical protein G5S_0233 [Chlamydia pecorum E58]
MGSSRGELSLGTPPCNKLYDSWLLFNLPRGVSSGIHHFLM